MDCEMASNFSYTVNTADPNSYFFNASYPIFSQYWRIDGGTVSSADTFTYVFSPGNHEVCYYRSLSTYNELYRTPLPCKKCITICVAEQEDLSTTEMNTLSKEKKAGIDTKTDVKHWTIPPGDIIPIDDNNIDKIKVYPNPTNNEWNVIIFNDISDKITISVFDMNVKLIYNEINNITEGENLFKVESKSLKTGSYIIEIKGNSIDYKEVVIKH
jgi:hypothetical protein